MRWFRRGGTTFANSPFNAIGWTVRAGIEWAFSDKWSLAGEFRYSDFGSRNVTLANTDPAAPANGLGIVAQTVNVRATTEQATLRLNYRLGAPAVVVLRPAGAAKPATLHRMVADRLDAVAVGIAKERGIV